MKPVKRKVMTEAFYEYVDNKPMSKDVFFQLIALGIDPRTITQYFEDLDWVAKHIDAKE